MTTAMSSGETVRRSVHAALAGSTCAALLIVGTPTPAQAYTEKELNVCWVNKAPGEWLDLEIVADGPSFKAASLDDGDCMAWNVRPGQYRITVEDVTEFRTAMRAACDPARTPFLKMIVERQGDPYKAGFRDIRHGGLITHVRKDRRTTVTAVLTCRNT